MIANNNCSFTNINEMFNSMTDEEVKEYFDDLETDFWVNEYKNNLI